MLQQRVQTGERLVSSRRLVFAAPCFFTIRVGDLLSRVLVIVAVETQQLPITPIRRIVVMVVILMMNRKLAQPLPVELASAPPTDPGKQLERLLAIGLRPLILMTPGLGNDSIPVAVIHTCVLC